MGPNISRLCGNWVSTLPSEMQQLLQSIAQLISSFSRCEALDSYCCAFVLLMLSLPTTSLNSDGLSNEKGYTDPNYLWGGGSQLFCIDCEDLMK